MCAPTPQTQHATPGPAVAVQRQCRARVTRARGLMNGPGTRGPVTHEPYCILIRAHCNILCYRYIYV